MLAESNDLGRVGLRERREEVRWICWYPGKEEGNMHSTGREEKVKTGLKAINEEP